MFTLLAFVLCVFAADFAGCSIIERRSTYDLCEGDVCLTGSNKTCLSLPVSVRIRGHYPGCYPNDLICRKVKTISIDVSHMEEHEVITITESFDYAVIKHLFSINVTIHYTQFELMKRSACHVRY